jgi:hypothetical protein
VSLRNSPTAWPLGEDFKNETELPRRLQNVYADDTKQALEFAYILANNEEMAAFWSSMTFRWSRGIV